MIQVAGHGFNVVLVKTVDVRVSKVGVTLLRVVTGTGQNGLDVRVRVRVGSRLEKSSSMELEAQFFKLIFR